MYVVVGRNMSRIVASRCILQGVHKSVHNSLSARLLDSQMFDCACIIFVVLTRGNLLPKQMLYQAELRPDRARHPSRFTPRRNAMHRNATVFPGGRTFFFLKSVCCHLFLIQNIWSLRRYCGKFGELHPALRFNRQCKVDGNNAEILRGIAE